MRLSRNRTLYYIKEGITSIASHSLMSFASVSIIVAFLVIMGSSILLAVNINSLIGDLEADNIVLAFVQEHFSEEEARAIRPLIAAIPNVAEVEFITREEAFEGFIGRFDGQDRFREIDAEILRHRYAVYVHEVALIADTMQELQMVRGIDTVSANLAIARGLVTLRTVVTWISVIIIAVLLAISLFIMSNTIKLATYERREEIAIMKMVGATNSFIRWPFVFEGFVLGMTGALAAFLALMGLYGLAADGVMEFETGFFQLVAFSTVSVYLLILFTGIGFAVGVGGSGLALNRYLKV